jgi:hypothetical protein
MATTNGDDVTLHALERLYERRTLDVGRGECLAARSQRYLSNQSSTALITAFCVSGVMTV